MQSRSTSDRLLEMTVGDTASCGDQERCDGAPADDSAVNEKPRETCPPPLYWPGVLSEFREHASSWELTTSAGTIRGRTWGEGPTLMFCNGLAGSHELFALAAYLLKSDFQCVLFDYPSRPGKSWPSLVAAALSVIDHFAGAEGCHLFGTSLGAALALDSLTQVAREIQSATLLAPFAHLPLTVFERTFSKLLRACPGRFRALPGWRSLQERSHRLWFPPVDPTRWEFFLDDIGQTPIADAARRFGMLANVDVRSRLTEIQTPVMLLHVEGEGSVQACLRSEIATLLPNSRTEFLHTTGLAAFLTHPHRVAKMIREFVAARVEE